MIYRDAKYYTNTGAYTTFYNGADGHYYTVLAPQFSYSAQNYQTYLSCLEKPFIKLVRLRFLQPDGSIAFALDNNAGNHLSDCFISEGSLSVNLQNGVRRTCPVTLSNVNGEFDYNVNNIWFGQEIALDEGMILPDGTQFYLQQGVFLVTDPQDNIQPDSRTITYNLVDKWANLDGTLYGNLEGTYEVPLRTNIFSPISGLLADDIGNGRVVDRIPPVYTVYYSNKTQELPNGTIVGLLESPYTLTVEGGGTYADVILGLNTMINGLVGYDASGALRIDASQEDISDKTKPVAWTFSPERTSLLGMTYNVKNTEVYNDYIVVGEQMDTYAQPMARAQNYDPRSDTNINIVGRKTFREVANGYATTQMCKDLAAFRLKRTTVLQKAVSISASQILHLQENQIVEIIRTDKPGAPMERHLIQGFSRPLTGTDNMTISAISVNDFPDLTITESDTLANN